MHSGASAIVLEREGEFRIWGGWDGGGMVCRVHGLGEGLMCRFLGELGGARRDGEIGAE